MGVVAISDIRDVAGRANVSIGTVSNAFKRPEKVAPETRQRIINIARELNYYPNQLASALVTSQTRLIGLMTSYAYSSNRGMAVNEFVRAAAQQGYMVLMASTEMNVEEEREVISRFIRYRVDGVIIYSDYIEGRTEHLKALKDNRIPCVVSKRFDPEYENISVSAERAFQDIAEQLKRYNHQHIGVVVKNLLPKDGGTPSVRIHRLETFRRQLKAVGLMLAEEDIIMVESDTIEAGEQVADEWLSSGREFPTMFLCMYDHLAIGLMTRLQSRGYDVPKDVSVVGYGNYEISAYSAPKLATVDLRETEILRKALEMLLERFDNPELKLRDVELEHKFIFRDSLGPANSRATKT